jgi:hypothetical protein
MAEMSRQLRWVRRTYRRWFKVEIFLHRGTSSSDNGRVWVAIDGHEVIDYNSSVDSTNAIGNMYAAGSPISRMNLPQMYGGNVWPRDQYVDDLEIWDGFPRTPVPTCLRF